MTDPVRAVVYEFNGFRLNPAERLLEQNGRAIPLTPKAFDLLVYLVERHGRLVEKDDAMSAVWPGTVVEEANLAFQVSTLRRALGDRREAESLIQTVPTKGYRFVGAVQVSRVRSEAGAMEPPSEAASPVSKRRIVRSRASIVGWSLAATAGVVATAALFWRADQRTTPPRPQPVRFELSLPPDIRHEVYQVGALSPNGEWFAFEAHVNGHDQLVLRNLASAELVRLGGSDRPSKPFWSPDSRSIAFFDYPGRLKVIPVEGGSARTLTEARWLSERPTGLPADDPSALSVSGTWRGDVILFTWWGRPYRLKVSDGTVSALATLPWKPGQKRFASPQLLPDGNHFLISVVDDTALYVGALDAPGKRKLLDDAAFARYAAGHVVYPRGGALYARPFDPDRLTAGAEMRIVDDADPWFVSVSDGGSVVYRHPGASSAKLTWFDRRGAIVATTGDADRYTQVALSPRADRATVVRADVQDFTDLWNVDLVSGVMSRLTTDPYDDSDPSWAPDEQALAFSSQRNALKGVFLKDFKTATEEPLVPSTERSALDQWTPDGRFIVYRTLRKTDGDTSPSGYRISVCAMPLEGDRRPRVLLREVPYIVDEVHVSPDGRWVAFNSDESGRWEVYVATFPEFTSKQQISSVGGVEPQWRGDSRELFYLGLDGEMMAVALEPTAELKAGPPTRLFATNMAADAMEPQYGVTRDGQRFLGLQREPGSTRFVFLLNWLLPGAQTGAR